MPEPTLTQVAEKRIVGIGVRTTNSEEMDPATANIPALWERFNSEGILDRIPNRSEEGVAFGVYSQFEGDAEGHYRVIAGAEVTSFADVPEGFESIYLPAGSYDVFPVEGEIPEAILDTWTDIWDHYNTAGARQRAFIADFERYELGEEITAEIYVSVS
jgi:predicted transcriptional regulator YdeE